MQVRSQLSVCRPPCLRCRQTSHARLVQGTNTQLWIVALPPEQQQAVYKTLTASQSTKVLNPLPGDTTHAWLVLADADTIQRVLDAHSFASAVGAWVARHRQQSSNRHGI